MRQHLVALIALMLPAVGCNMSDVSSGGQNNAPSTNSSANTTANPPKGVADSNKEIAAAFENLKTQPFVTAKIDNDGPDTKYDKVIEAAGPEKVRLVYVYASDFEADPSTASEIIQIGKDIFEKKALDGIWNKTEYSITVFDEMTVGPLSAIDFTRSGDESVDGKQVSVYSLAVVSPEAPKGISGKVWIRNDKRVPLKARVERPNGSSTTYTYDLDTPIKPIEAPRNVKIR